jgi:hypothetical protein
VHIQNPKREVNILTKEKKKVDRLVASLPHTLSKRRGIFFKRSVSFVKENDCTT